MALNVKLEELLNAGCVVHVLLAFMSVKRNSSKLVAHYKCLAIFAPLSIEGIVHNERIDAVNTRLEKLFQNLFGFNVPQGQKTAIAARHQNFLILRVRGKDPGVFF